MPINTVPIVELDIVGFTSVYDSEDKQREVVIKLRDIVDQAGKILLPHGNFGKTFQHHGTGDGYFIDLGSTSPLATLGFTQEIIAVLNGHNEDFGDDFPIDLRIVIGYGQLQKVADQWYGTVLANAERLMSADAFKLHQKKSGQRAATLISDAFYRQLLQDIKADQDGKGDFADLHNVKWTRRAIRDKHSKEHIGYLLGDAGQWPETNKAAETPPPASMPPATQSPHHEYDVFLCHNSNDKPAIRKIYNDLKKRGLRPWLDEKHLRPGLPWQKELEKQIGSIKAVAVFIGESGLGPWQDMELDAFLREFARRKCPVIPVILSEGKTQPDLPIFLNAMTWVDFHNKESDPLELLIWGITGDNPHENPD